MARAANQSHHSLVPAIALACFGLLWVSALTLSPRMGEPIAAIYPPWISSASAFAATVSADTDEIRGIGGWGNVIVAQSSDPAFIERLRHSGALLVLRASSVAGCLR